MSSAHQTVAWRRLVIVSLHRHGWREVCDEPAPVDDAVETRSAKRSTIGCVSPAWYAVSASKYRSVSVRSGRDWNGHRAGEPLASKQAVHYGSPVRPLPSGNGWIVSNWAWAMAACGSTGRSSRRMKRTRSSIAGTTRVWCGGTNRCGVHSCSSRSRPAQSAISRNLRFVLFEQNSVHGKDRGRIEVVGERDRRLHCARVGDDLGGIAPSRIPQFGQCDRLRRRGPGSRFATTPPIPNAGVSPRTGRSRIRISASKRAQLGGGLIYKRDDSRR